MKNLSDFLQRITGALDKDVLAKQAAIDSIRLKTNISLLPEQIYLHEGILEITASPSVKSEIKLKEAGIREEFKTRNLFVSKIFFR